MTWERPLRDRMGGIVDVDVVCSTRDQSSYEESRRGTYTRVGARDSTRASSLMGGRRWCFLRQSVAVTADAQACSSVLV
jgi:hypothetical protein